MKHYVRVEVCVCHGLGVEMCKTEDLKLKSVILSVCGTLI